MGGKSTRAGELHLVYVDECEVHRHPRLAKVWRRCGSVLRGPAAGEDKKFAMYGGLDYDSGRVVWDTDASKNGATFVRFLDPLAEAFPDGQLVLVLDNVGYHNSHEVRRWWVAHDDRLRPLWLPAYSPEWNLIERVWRHLKDTLSNHRWWADLPVRERATGVLLERMDAHFHRPKASRSAQSRTSARLVRCSAAQGCILAASSHRLIHIGFYHLQFHDLGC